MSIFIPGGKAGGGGLATLWYDSKTKYPKDAYVYYWDYERPDWITMYHNKTGKPTVSGAFDPLVWERKGSFNDTPWSMEFAQTGLIYGGNITQTGPLQYKVEAGSGLVFGVVDKDGTSETTHVEWKETLHTANFASSSTIYLFVNKNGAINEIFNPPSSASYRSMIYLGVVIQDPLDAKKIGGITFAPYANYMTAQTMQDLHRRLFTPCLDAGNVKAVAKTMKISHNTLRFYSYASNWGADVNDPHMQSIKPLNPLKFTEVDQKFNVIRSDVSDVNPANWDNGKVEPLTGKNKITVHRLFYSIPLKKYFLQLGQNTYETMIDAKDAFQNEEYSFAKPLTSMANAIIIAYVITDKDAKTLDDATKAEVKSGGCAFASGASSSIEYIKDLLDVNVSLPLKLDHTIIYNDTKKMWENKFPNPFTRLYEQTANGDVSEMDAVFFDGAMWRKAIANDARGRKLAQGIAVNVQANPSPTSSRTRSSPTSLIDVVLFGVLEKKNHGFTTGATYYLSNTTEGAVTDNKPNKFKQVVFTVLNHDKILIANSSTAGDDAFKGWLDPSVNNGGISAGAVVDNTTDYSEGDYIISLIDGVYDFTSGTVGGSPPGIKVQKGERFRYDGSAWESVSPAGLIRLKGWFDPDADGGGDDVDFPVINNSTDYDDGQYVVVLSDGKYDFTTGKSSKTGTEVHEGERLVYKSGTWAVVSPIIEKPKMQGWLDPSVDGGGKGVPETVRNGTKLYSDDDYVIISKDGRYNFATNKGNLKPTDAGTDVFAGERWKYSSGVWTNATIADRSRMKGWFDPDAAGGGDDVISPVINGTKKYADGTYVVALSDGKYDFVNGNPSKTGTQVHEGERLVFNNGTWEVVSLIVEKPKMRGWLDPLVDKGGAEVTDTIINGSKIYSNGDYVVVTQDGRYDFATAKGGVASTVNGTDLKAGERWKYSGGVWTNATPAAAHNRMNGWFDPESDGGGVDVNYSVINGSTDYVDGDYVIVTEDGNYDFATGKKSATGDEVHEGEMLVYNGGVWAIVSQEIPKPMMKGWLDPTVDHLNAVVNGTNFYTEDNYLIVTKDGRYDFATGKGGVAPTDPGTDLKAGERWRYNGSTWVNSTLVIDPIRMKGWFDPDDANGGDDVDFPVVDGSKNYSNGEYVIVLNDGAYNFATGKKSTTGDDVHEGEMLVYNGGKWGVVAQDVIKPKMQGWFDPMVNGGGLADRIFDGTGAYSDGDYVVVTRDGRYNLANGNGGLAPADTGTDFHAGERWKYSNKKWVIASPAAATPPRARMKGWFEPSSANGGSEVEFPVNNATADYVDGDYVVVTEDGTYDFATGKPSTTGTTVSEGDRLVYNGGAWSIVSQEVPHPMMKGWLDPTVDHLNAVVNGTNFYTEDDYLIVTKDGRYDFATGKGGVAPTASGTDLKVGERWRYSGGAWINAGVADRSRMKGWFDPSVAGGGTRVPSVVSDNAAGYINGSFIIAEGVGRYDFAAGTPVTAPAGVEINAGEIYRYNGTTWQLIGVQKAPNNIGFFDPNNKGGKGTVTDDIINGGANFQNGQYAIALTSGSYDFINGGPFVAGGSPAGVETVINSGSRIVYDGTSWSVLASGSGLLKGFMDASAANGGAAINDPIVNGTTDYLGNECVIVETPGKYNFATGQPDPNGTELHRGETVVYDGTNWRVNYGERTFYMNSISSAEKDPSKNTDWQNNPNNYKFYVWGNEAWQWITDFSEVALGGGALPSNVPGWLKVSDRNKIRVGTNAPSGGAARGMFDHDLWIEPHGIWEFIEKEESFDTSGILNNLVPEFVAVDNPVADASSLPKTSTEGTVLWTKDDKHVRVWTHGAWKDTGVILQTKRWYKKFNFEQTEHLFKGPKDLPTGNPNDDPNIKAEKSGEHLLTHDAVWMWEPEPSIVGLKTEPDAVKFRDRTGADPRTGYFDATLLNVPRPTDTEGDFVLDTAIFGGTANSHEGWIFKGGAWQNTGNVYGPGWVKDFDLGSNIVFYRDEFELNADGTPLSTDKGKPGEHLITKESVWKWVTDESFEAKRAAISQTTTPGQWVGSMAAVHVKPASGTAQNWTSPATEPAMTPNQIGYWMDVTPELGSGSFPLTLTGSANITVEMSDGTTRGFTLPAKTYPDAARTDGGSSTATNSLGYQLFYDGLPTDIAGTTFVADGFGKIFFRVDVADTSSIWAVRKGVATGASHPTTRLDGSPLQPNDYCVDSNGFVALYNAVSGTWKTTNVHATPLGKDGGWVKDFDFTSSGGGSATNIKFDDINSDPNAIAPWNANNTNKDYLITSTKVYQYLDDVVEILRLQTGIDLNTMDTTDATVMNQLDIGNTDYALTTTNYVGQFADTTAFQAAAMARANPWPGDWGFIGPAGGSPPGTEVQIAYLGNNNPGLPTAATPLAPVTKIINHFADPTKAVELTQNPNQTDITGWHLMFILGGSDSPDRYRAVNDAVARTALNDPTDIVEGVLVFQKDSKKMWLYTNKSWEEYLPAHPTGPTGPGLKRLEYDATKVIGDQIRWVDDRQSLAIVSDVGDLNDRTLLPTAHVKRGKLVFVRNTGEIYEMVNDPDDGTMTGTAVDWKIVNEGGVGVYNRVSDLPSPTATGINVTPVKEGDVAVVRFHSDAVTPLGNMFAAIKTAGRAPVQPTKNILNDDGTPVTLTGIMGVAPGGYKIISRTDPLIDINSLPVTIAEEYVSYVLYSDGAIDEIHLAAGTYNTLGDLRGPAFFTVPGPHHRAYVINLETDNHTYLEIDSDGSTAFPVKFTSLVKVSSNPMKPRVPGSIHWEPISRDIFTKATLLGADTPDPMPRDIQVTLEKGHKEVKLWDIISGRWIVVYSEDDVKKWIAAGNLFVGTVQDVGHGTAGAMDIDKIPAETALGSTDKGHYWVFVGRAGYTIAVGEVGGAASAIEGQTLNVGDWIQVAEPTPGIYQYTVIPGDLLAKTRGDALYGLNIWQKGSYEQGTLITHQGGVYKSAAAILATDPAPDDATNVKWNKIPISGGVHNVAADANLPATAPAGEVYLVINSNMAGGLPGFYIWDQPTMQWIRVGGGGGGVPMNLRGGELIFNIGTPIGSITMWPKDTPPKGWLLCNGAVFDGLRYPVLYQLLGDNHTPDLRGQFIRGAPAILDGYKKHQWTTGKPRKNFTTNQTGNHQHDYWDGRNSGGRGLKGADHFGGELWLNPAQKPTWAAGNHTHTVNGGGDSETAPNHVLLNFIIKAEDQNLDRRII